MLAGAVWAIAMRWCMRLLGLFSVVILARLLTPADFGIVAMAALVIALIDSFAELGADFVLLRQAEVTRAQCDTAWTFRLLQGVVTAVLVLAAAPLAARFFDEPRLVPVMAALAGVAVVAASSNIGMTLLRKELRFAADFRFGVYRKLVEVAATVALAYLLRDYWALVLGSVVGAMAGVMISYRMHPYRPRFALGAYREYLSFSIASVASNVAKLLKSRADVLLLGGTSGAANTGSYNVAAELARMGTQEIVVPAWRGLFPSFAAIRDDRPRFFVAFARLLAVVATLCLPLAVGLWALAPDLVPVLLGEQWHGAIAPLRWLALAAALVALADTFGGSVLLVTGHERQVAVLMWLHVVVLVPLVFVASRSGQSEPVAQACLLAAGIVLPASAIVLQRSIAIPFTMLWQALWRPIAATGVMAVVLTLFTVPAVEWQALRLVLRSLAGGAVFAASLLLLWIAAGQPDGVERTVLAWVGERRRRHTP
jgi:lipopolysaccharide exporter